jgi:predicted DNA-binding protein (MmcQ/YjbR family)
MNKKHWNTINLDGTVPDKEVFSWIDNSYNLVAARK